MAQSNIRVSGISGISGEVNIASGNIIRNIRTIYERSLTAAEELSKARSLEGKLLAEGVSSYIQRLQTQAKNERGTGTPYKGLLEYRLAEAESFHGRKQARKSLLETMARGPLAILHAESGAGKTSLLQAGIAPRILAHGHLPLYLRPYDKSPSLAIKKAFLPDLGQSPILAQSPLRDFLARVAKILGKNSALFIMLDQFEEFFLRVDEKEQAAFINELGECLDDKALSVCWLISLRSEYFGRLANFRPRIQNPYENDFLLNRLTREEAREAIVTPAQKHKIKFEPGLVDKILDDLGTNQIVPPQLQLVCSALYEALALGENLFTKEMYEVREGGTNGILRGHLERVLKRLTPNGRVTAHQVLEALITSVQQRALRPRTELIHSLLARGMDASDLQSTIDQLVESRLLRVEESDDGPVYELAHDYLLDEIKLDPEMIKIKQAEELLAQGLSNWRKHQLLIAPDVQKVVEEQKENLIISSEAAKVLFLSAIEHRRPADGCADLISAKELEALITSFLEEDDGKNSRAGLWGLRRYLTPWLRVRVLAIRFGLGLLTYFWRLILILLVSALGVLLIFALIYSTPQFVNWTEISKLGGQCLDGNQTSRPLAAIDALDGSHIFVFDRGSGKLCETKDTGVWWQSIETNLSTETMVKSITANEHAYILTDQEIVHQTENSTWETIALPSEAQFPLQEIAISTNRASIFVIGLHGPLYAYDTNQQRWNKIHLEGVTGEITDMAVNYGYLAVSTTEGIWYQNINGNGNWKKFDNHLNREITIVSVAMYRHIPSWAGNIIDWRDSDRLLALTDTGELYSAYLTEKRGLESLPTPFSLNPTPDSLSLAVNQNSNFAVNATSILCKQTWIMLEVEWWKYKFCDNKPCQ